VSPCWEHIKKESNKSGPEDQGGEEIAKGAPIGPRHNEGRRDERRIAEEAAKATT